MDTRILVKESIASGEDLIRYLDSKNLDIKIAFWFLDTEIDRWYLFISTPLVDLEGPRKVYRKILDAMEGIDTEIGFTDIKVIPYNSPLANTFKNAMNTGEGISNIRFQENAINGILIEDALVYRVN